MPLRLQSSALDVAVLSTLVAASAIPGVSPNPRALAKRYYAYGPHTITGINCGSFSTADGKNTWNNVVNLANADTKTVGAKSCNRFGCYNTSGVYVCNDNDSDITITNADASAFAGFIYNVCGMDHSISGQAFTADQGGYNVVVAFCDNNEPVDSVPSQYTPPGPNGAPVVVCGANNCDQGSCEHGTIVMLTQENVICDTFLAPNTIGAGAQYTYSTQHTVGTTWTVGGLLGIDSSDLGTAAVSAAFLATFAETVTNGDISGIDEQCGQGMTPTGDYTCDLQVGPGCFHMSGTCIPAAGQPFNVATPYDTTMPQEITHDGQNSWTGSICTCHNCCGWADPEAPPLTCFQDCDTCVQLEVPC